MATSAPGALPDFDDPVADHARSDLPLLEIDMTVSAALEKIRAEGVSERVIYFYAVDKDRKLRGVVPTRRLLTAPLDAPVAEIMISKVVAIPATATVLDACEFFILYKFFAFPVVDAERRIVGVVDVNLFAEELLSSRDNAEIEKDEVFEVVGFHLSQVRDASPWRVFRYRFPWLLATVAGGTACAVLAGFFEATLASSLVIAFFLTLVLGLNESVSMQSMALTIQALRSTRVTARWFGRALRREVLNAALLGLGCGAIVGAVVFLWQRHLAAAATIGGSIAISMVAAACFGLAIPSLLHWLKLDPKIAAGPITLAITDLATLAFYLSIATLVLR
ncbi:magnesium transporter [soil metagenome]